LLTRIRGLARPTKLSMRSFWTCRMIRSEDGLSAVKEKGGKLWRVLRDPAVKSTSQSGERGPVRSFSLECGSRPRGPPSRRCSISLSMTSWLHDTCSEHGICMGQTG
jgi:hypothetical protein